MGFRLGRRSRRNLKGVHPDLVKVVERAIEITKLDFTVIEGLRTMARQRELVADGASKTYRSRHLTGHAVDLMALDCRGRGSWHWPLYTELANAMLQAARELGVAVEWGGHWRTFKDGPHFQLSWKNYPRS